MSGRVHRRLPYGQCEITLAIYVSDYGSSRIQTATALTAAPIRRDFAPNMTYTYPLYLYAPRRAFAHSIEVAMAGILGSIKRVLTGEILHQIDTPIIQGKSVMSLRLKRQTGSDKQYVVLAGISLGNYQYFPFDLDEFDRFVEAAIAVRAAAQSAIVSGKQDAAY